MATSANAKVQIELGVTLVTFIVMTDSGNRQTFTSADSLWSGKSGSEPIVRPNGITTGSKLVTEPASGSVDVVDVAAFSAQSLGVVNSVGASVDEALTTPTGSFARINSITMTSAGAIAVVAGTTATDTTFSDTRAASGGPPLIPVDSVEVAQVRMTASSAVIAKADILQVPGQHSERADFPVNIPDNIGRGLAADTSAETNAHVEFESQLPASHTGPTAKRTYIQYSSPIFSDLSKALDYTPAETTHTVNSTQYYDGQSASRSSSLGQGGFTALLEDGTTDSLVTNRDEILTVKFFPDKNKSPFQLTQGTIGMSRRYPVSDPNQAEVTISSEKSSSDFSG
ncbi:MAG: hypothetical protein JRD69_10165 [Deltaproteobacteria bacterium]|nr:hypothetical protein [Deltaproteobacteria bacterium]